MWGQKIYIVLGCFLHHPCLWGASRICSHPQNDSGCIQNYYLVYKIELDDKTIFSEHQKKGGEGKKERTERVATTNGGEKNCEKFSLIC